MWAFLVLAQKPDSLARRHLPHLGDSWLRRLLCSWLRPRILCWARIRARLLRGFRLLWWLWLRLSRLRLRQLCQRGHRRPSLLRPWAGLLRWAQLLRLETRALGCAPRPESLGSRPLRAQKLSRHWAESAKGRQTAFKVVSESGLWRLQPRRCRD